MAKKKVDEIIVAEEMEVVEPVQEEVKVEEEVVIAKVESTPIQRNVKVLMKADHRCCIGGEWYFFKEGKQYNVPENVKTILLKADKLSPL